MPKGTTTYGILTGKHTGEQLIYFQAVSRANRLVLQAVTRASRTQGISGLKCCELSKRFNRPGFWQKTFTGLLLSKGAWFSKQCALTWKVQALKSSRILFRLVPSGPSTKGNGFGFWPTPTASDNGGTCKKIPYKKQSYLKYFLHRLCRQTRSCYPHPTLLEAMMGYPNGWTELKPSEMPSSHR